MPGPVWNNDHHADAATISDNAARLIKRLAAEAPSRELPIEATVLAWHSEIYLGCQVPVATYIGHFRGDTSVPELVGYEVGVGDLQHDGFPSKVGVWSVNVRNEVNSLFGAIRAAVAELDRLLPVGRRPGTVAELNAIVQLTASVHGEWVRIHPFANGNGRIARVWAAWLAFRYQLPAWVSVKPRPDDSAYAAAAKASMGRPPDFIGDHTLASHVFAHMLTLSLLE